MTEYDRGYRAGIEQIEHQPRVYRYETLDFCLGYAQAWTDKEAQTW